MAADAPNALQPRKSRFLEALDNPSFLSQPPPAPESSLAGSKRAFQTPEPDYDSEVDLSEILGGSQKKKRRVAAPDGAAASSTPAKHASPVLGGHFTVRYDAESSVQRIDIGGPDQAMKLAEFVSKAIDNASHGLDVKKALKKLGLQDRMDLIPGVEVRLLPHQVIGVCWMIDQERVSPHKGGILADDMGLGKTVQMIATMVMNQPPEDERHKVTLIVVPAALALQWKDEIDSKTNKMFDVHIQHGRQKIQEPDLLEEKDIIITTYHTLNMDFYIPKDVDSSDELEYLRQNGGPLTKVKYYRVILDEAQFVRNRSTRSSKAVALLRSQYRWCLTGTPVTNSLADLYGFLRFGRFRPWNDWTDFNAHVAKVQLTDAPLAGARAQKILEPLLLRRTKDATIDGEPILQLPPKDVELVFVEFSKGERDLYEAFEKKAQVQIDRFIKANSLLRNTHVVLVLLLRLRQMCAHPHLTLSQAEGFDDPTLLVGSEGDKEIARASKAMGAKWVVAIKSRYMERARAMQLDNDADVDELEEASCPVCNDLFIDGSGRVLSCGHEICADCLDVLRHAPVQHNGIFGNDDEATNLRIEKEFEAAAAKGLRPCPTCKKMQDLRPANVFLAHAFEPHASEVKEATRRARHAPVKRPAKKAEVINLSDSDSSSDDDMPDVRELMKAVHTPRDKGKARAVEPVINDAANNPLEPDAFLIATWKDGGVNAESSAKMVSMMNYLKEWEATGDKTIVFSQWTRMLDIIEQVFARNGIRNLRYDGKMSREARELALSQFRGPGGPKIMLISIKCGGVGLNLVSANRVINLDLSWNFASESQAYDRVHRLGQDKDVVVKRLIVRNSIEERMLTLQDTKLGLADAALGEGNGIRLNKLSVAQLKALFGMSRRPPPPPPADNSQNARSSSPEDV